VNTYPPLPHQPESLHEAPRWGSRLFKLGLILLAAVEIYYAFHAEVRTQTHLLLGLLMVGLAFLPALLWARQGRASLPVFEALLFTCANAYALPLLNGHSDLVRYTDEDITRAAFGVIVFQVFAISIYQMVSANVSSNRFWREDVLSRTISRWLGYGVGLNTLYIVVSTFTTLIPSGIGSVLRAVFFGLGIICMFITSRRLGLGELGPGQRAYFLINLAIQCVCMMATLYLVTTVSLVLLTLTGYVSSSGRVPLIATGLCLLTLALLHNGKSAMREKYWSEERVVPRPIELPAFYNEWIYHGLEKDITDKDRQKITGKLIDRTSLFHIMCLVVSATPSQQSYLYGETYRDIPAQFVPRLFWPGKPLGHVSTSRLSVYYGLQSEEDTQKTTIGFGMLSEAYANFGYLGLALLGALVGGMFKKIQGWASDGPLFSYGGLLLIILLAWSFQVEFTLSIWLASLYQASVAVLGIPFIIRQFFGE
jgi:hypothetical protein